MREQGCQPAGTTEDARVTRTKAALFEAIRDLLKADGANLSISTVCERAGVSRPAFYQHFTSLDDLLQAAVRDRLRQIKQRAVASGAGAPGRAGSARVLEAMLEELAGERDLYTGTLGDTPVARRLQSTFEDYLRERWAESRPGLDPTTLSFACGGVSRLIIDWLGQGPERISAAELASSLWRLVDAVVPSADDPAGRDDSDDPDDPAGSASAREQETRHR